MPRKQNQQEATLEEKEQILLALYDQLGKFDYLKNITNLTDRVEMAIRAEILLSIDGRCLTLDPDVNTMQPEDKIPALANEIIADGGFRVYVPQPHSPRTLEARRFETEFTEEGAGIREQPESTYTDRRQIEANRPPEPGFFSKLLFSVFGYKTNSVKAMEKYENTVAADKQREENAYEPPALHESVLENYVDEVAMDNRLNFEITYEYGLHLQEKGRMDKEQYVKQVTDKFGPEVNSLRQECRISQNRFARDIQQVAGNMGQYRNSPKKETIERHIARVFLGNAQLSHAFGLRDTDPEALSELNKKLNFWDAAPEKAVNAMVASKPFKEFLKTMTETEYHSFIHPDETGLFPYGGKAFKRFMAKQADLQHKAKEEPKEKELEDPENRIEKGSIKDLY